METGPEQPLLKEIQVTDVSERVKIPPVTERSQKRIIEKILLLFVILFLCAIAVLLGFAVIKVDQLKTVSKNGVQTLLDEVHHLNPLQIVVRLQTIASAIQNMEGLIGKLSTQNKYHIPYTTPIKNQGLRSNSWVFATISLLEQQYRNQGNRDGYLNSTSYLTFSEQSYEAWMLLYCQKEENRKIPLCEGGILDDFEGGFVHFLFELREQLDKTILPSFACPYNDDPSSDLTFCPDYDDRLATNPIVFQVINMDVTYDIKGMKKMICEAGGRSLTLTMNIPSSLFYTPCVNNNTCDYDICIPCPSERYHSECCNIFSNPGYNHHGEFFTHYNKDMNTGHYSMLVIGFNDNYVTTTGQKGGFIVKNSWGSSQGGHSIDFFNNDISYADELSVCPNSFSAQNWYICGSKFKPSFENCFSDTTIISARNQYKPLKLHCRPNRYFNDFSYCNTNNDIYTYYLLNSSRVLYDDYIYNMCFLEHDINSNHYRDFCIGPYYIDTYSLIFTPNPENFYSNSPYHCGFFFVPYSYLSFSVQSDTPSMLDIIIEFDPSSYIANQDSYSQYEYSYLRQSMKNEIPMTSFDRWPVPYHV